MKRVSMALMVCLLSIWGHMAAAQDLTVSTVTRAPFSMPDGDGHAGFSIDLMDAIATELGRAVTYARADNFAAMLAEVEEGRAEVAIANISITAERESRLDFSQPMFDSGIQVMVPASAGSGTQVLNALLTRQFALLAGAGIAMLFGAGMLMWLLERGRKSWFDRPASEAAFPAFWWALNLIFNGGFEERMPHSRMGRGLAVLLVISSLFFVSIFIAQITTSLTVTAITNNVEDLNDLDGRPIGTISGSTSANFLDLRGMPHRGFDDLDTLLDSFAKGDLDAVVFDGPILAYYANETAQGQARVLERIYRPENYGIALPTGSTLREPVNQAILRLRENGTYTTLLTKWFGPTYSPN